MSHHCHWPGCPVEVPPKLWGCKKHWYMLPKYLRDKIWATYRPGQEVTKDPSDAYWDAAMEVREWIEANHQIVPVQWGLPLK
jgi:hypothetical protein